MPARVRIFRTADRIWGFGFGYTRGHWHLQFAKWVLTTEVDMWGD